VLRGKYIAMNAYIIKNTDRCKKNEQMLHLKLINKQNKLNPKPSEGFNKNKD
jgi:hypothetical protein